MTEYEAAYLSVWCLATFLMVVSKPLEEQIRPNGKLRSIHSPHDGKATILGCWAMLWPYLLIFAGIRPPHNFIWWIIGVCLSGMICMIAIIYWQRRYEKMIARWFVIKQSIDLLLRACVQAIWWWLVWR